MILKNLLSILLSVVLCFILVFVLQYFEFCSLNSIYGIGFLSVLFLILNFLYLFFRNKESFSQLMLVGITVKLLLSLSLIALYSFFYKGDFFQFAIIFVINYVIFTIFEIRFLLQLIKNTNLNKHSSQ